MARIRLYRGRTGAARGMTLVELVIAVGLASILMLAVFRLLDTSLSLWSRGEVRRSALEQGTATAELLAHDLRSLHRGVQGDLVAEWIPFDTDGDGKRERFWPRLVFVRQASPGELARLARAAEAEDAAAAREQEEQRPGASARPEGEDEAPVPTLQRPEHGLLEIAWAVLPAGEDPAEGVLWRGERVVGEGTGTSFLAEGFFAPSGQPPVGALNEVAGGLLWFGMAFATQTSLVQDGWEIGVGLGDAAGSWDAWCRERPDPNTHTWNEPGSGVPSETELSLLPRRVRVELEFERAVDRARRTRTTGPIGATDTSFEVENGGRLPGEAGAFILIDAEWMRLVGVDGNRVQVQRAQRGTEPRLHDPGALVHHGARVVGDVPIELHDDTWNL